MYFITILAIVRCYAVLKPYKYRVNCVPSRVHKICAAAWVWALVFALMPYVGFGKYESHGSCYCLLDTKKYPYSWLFYCIVNYIIPTVVNGVAFVSTAKKLKIKDNFTTPNYALNSLPVKSASPLSLLRSKRNKSVLNEPFEMQDTTTVEVTDEPATIFPDPSGEIERKSPIDNKLTVKVNIEIDPDSAAQQRYSTKRNSKQNQRKSVIRIMPMSEPHLQSIDDSKVEVGKICTVQASGTFEEPSKTKKEHDIHLLNITKKKSDLENTTRDNENQNPEELRSIPNQFSQQFDHIKKHQRKKSAKKDKQVLKIALFFLSYVLFYGPMVVFRSWYAVMPEDVPKTALAAAQILPSVNSLINPFIYGYLSEEIRHDIKQLFLYLCGKFSLK
ncbi:hypothetical protein AC249_AIPGENE4862 [Exaiptasia diaphana]|nr:hypothetical protein AC249_AIPGENE4862 [Exaiptasia diaphana]